MQMVKKDIRWNHKVKARPLPIRIDMDSKRYVTYPELQVLLSIGKGTAYQLARSAGAERRVGKGFIVNMDCVYRYIEGSNGKGKTSGPVDRK